MLTIRYLGHSAFALDDGQRTVLVDPFISGNPVSPVSSDEFNPSTILVTHAHNDHVGDSIELSKRTGAPIICTFELANYLAQQGANTIGANHGGTVQFEGGSAKFTPAWHTSSYNDGENVVAPGVPAGFIVRFGGQTTYFAGDTSLFGDMQLIGEEGIDIAVLPIGDHFTMGPKDAVRAARFVNPGTVIPCHYNTFPPIQQDKQAFRQQLESETSARCVPLEPGESHQFGG